MFPVLVLQSPFLTDFDSNLMVFDMDYWAYAVVDNLMQKGNVGNGERGTGNGGRKTWGNPSPEAKAATGNGERESRVRSAECRMQSEKLNKGNAGDLTQRPRRVPALAGTLPLLQPAPSA